MFAVINSDRRTLLNRGAIAPPTIGSHSPRTKLANGRAHTNPGPRSGLTCPQGREMGYRRRDSVSEVPQGLGRIRVEALRQTLEFHPVADVERLVLAEHQVGLLQLREHPRDGFARGGGLYRRLALRRCRVDEPPAMHGRMV